MANQLTGVVQTQIQGVVFPSVEKFIADLRDILEQPYVAEIHLGMFRNRETGEVTAQGAIIHTPADAPPVVAVVEDPEKVSQ